MAHANSHQRITFPMPTDPEGDMVAALDHARKTWHDIVDGDGSIDDADAVRLLACLAQILQGWDACIDLAVREGAGVTLPRAADCEDSL